jgi:hypothetical protein
MTQISGKHPLAQQRVLGERSVRALARMLAERGLSEDEIDRGLDYVAISGAQTMRQAFVLAMSRVLYSDAQLAAGLRFTLVENAPADHF